MKSVLFSMICLIGFSAQSQDLGRFDCNPSPDMPSYHLVRTTKDTFQFTAYFPGGTAQAPIGSGDVNVSSLIWLQAKSDFVQKLGDRYNVEIPASQCIRKSVDGQFYVHCFLKNSVTINGVNLTGLSFYAASKKITSLTRVAGTYQTVTDEEVRVGTEVGVATSIGTQLLDFAHTYSAVDCRSNPEFWN